VQIAAAEREIAVVSPLLARGEGGIVHHRNVFPMILTCVFGLA
jgi:hypothetical protein